MAKWRVRKYEWEANKQVVEEEVIEADDVCTVDGALVFGVADRPPIKLRASGEWFAVDRIDDQQAASVELPATRMELTDEGWRVSHEAARVPELA